MKRWLPFILGLIALVLLGAFYYAAESREVKNAWGWWLALGYGVYVCAGILLRKTVQLAATSIHPDSPQGSKVLALIVGAMFVGAASWKLWLG